MPTPSIQRRWKNLPGEPVGDAGDPYTGYDRFGRTEQMRWIKPHTGDSGFDTLVNVQWGYNRASQKTWRKDLLAPASAGQDQLFGYDGLYQVTERQRGLLNTNTTAVGGIPAQQENFGYDETGNWITYKQSNEGALSIDESRVNNRSNQMTQVDGSSAGISYDANGNMLTVPTGEGLTGPSRKLVWDGWNRLRKVSDEEDNVIAEYQYDGSTRRTTTQSEGITKHCYYDDQWRTVEERLDASTTPVTQHVWHPTDRWDLLFRDRSTANNGTLDERLYSLKDQLDPVAICDTSGSVVERYDYTAFGMPTILNADFAPKEPNTSSFDWNFLFHAEFADAETNWFNYGYRYYVPTLGRWLSRDPIGEDGGLNLYTMVGNNAFNRNDSLGLFGDWLPIVGTISQFANTLMGTYAGMKAGDYFKVATTNFDDGGCELRITQKSSYYFALYITPNAIRIVIDYAITLTAAYLKLPIAGVIAVASTFDTMISLALTTWASDKIDKAATDAIKLYCQCQP